MRLGSKRTLFLIPTAVLLVLLLSVIWQTHNASFLTLGSHTFATSTLLKPQREAPELIGLIGGVGEAVSGMFSFEVFADVNIGISIVWEGIMNLFFADVGFVQILLWSIVFYAVAYIPLFFHGRWSQFVPSLALLLLIPIHLVAADLSIVDPNMEIVPAVAVTVFMMFLLDWFGVKITREEELVAETKRGMFGLPGLVDLSVAKTGPATLEEIGNYESTKKEIHESILMPLKHRELTLVYGIRPPKGILLFGPPGTGKTLLMSALAKELRMPFYYVKCSEILSQWYGESEKNVAELFKAARKNAPCILFFDEIDSIGKKREMYANDETTPRVLSSILTEMDGMKEKEQVIVVAATNTPNILDPALLRPGRLDKIIYQPPPDDVGREAIFKIYLRKLPLDKSVDIKKLAKVTERFTGADIANVVIEAARVAAPAAVEKGKIIPLKMDDFTSVLKTLKPSVTYEMLEDYEKFRVDFERRAVKEEIKPMEERVVTWNDVIGLDDVRKILTESIELPLLHEEKLKEYKVRPAKGILLFGPPGTGKTLVVKAASHELKATFLSLTPADISRYGYEGAVRLLKETFNRARENAPAVLFIDELESIAPSREAYASKITEEMVAELLQQMDGLKELKNVILVGATNKPSLIDKALLRPGRLDKIIFVGPPNKDGRIQLFKHNLEGIKGAEKIDYTKVADETEGFTGADIASICQEVKLKLVRAKIAGEVEPEVTAQSLMDVAENRTRSVTVQMLKEYLAFVKEYGERR
jgi:SpoVK/Ycf46/Vps4 family AAA+-type ATPase